MKKRSKKIKTPRTGIKWNNLFYVKSYQLARNGCNNKLIASTIGVTLFTYEGWVDKKPALREALVEGRKKENLQAEYILGKLSPEARKVWDKVQAIETQENDFRKLEMLFERSGEGIRKQLFLHALVNSYFNPTQACKKVNIPYSRFKKWLEEDFDFSQLLLQIQEHKGNLYEEKLTKVAVEDEDVSALIHINKTFNRNRGYGEKLEIEHTGVIRNELTISLDEALLDRLSRPARRELLTVIDQLQLDQKETVNGNAQTS